MSRPTAEIEICKSVLCLTCNETSVVENSTLQVCYLSVAAQKSCLYKCWQHCFSDEVVRDDVDCSRCRQKKCTKIIGSRIVNCPAVLVVVIKIQWCSGKRRENKSKHPHCN